MKFLSLLGIIFFLASFPYANADFAFTEWRYEKQIGTRGASGFVELAFDKEVFSYAVSGLRDLRIISGDGGEVPYKLVVEKSAVERAQLSGRMLDKGYRAGEYISFVFDLGKAGLFHNKVDLQSPAENFRREVVIEAGDDGANWAVIQGRAFIYDVSDKEIGLKARSTSIGYPESTKRYLKVKVLDKGDGNFNILSASVFFEKKIEAESISYTADIIERSEDQERRVSVLLFDLGSSGLPHSSLALSVSSSNFEREISIEGSNDRVQWSVIASRDVIFSFSTPRFNGSKTAVSYPESNYRYLRATISNKDNPPLIVRGASASGILRNAVFEATSGESYKLFYGNKDARYPQYDIERYFRYLEVENLPKATLGAHAHNPLFEEKVPPPPPLSERSPWLLPAILGIAILTLGTLLVKLFLAVKKNIKPL